MVLFAVIIPASPGSRIYPAQENPPALPHDDVPEDVPGEETTVVERSFWTLREPHLGHRIACCDDLLTISSKISPQSLQVNSKMGIVNSLRKIIQQIRQVILAQIKDFTGCAYAL